MGRKEGEEGEREGLLEQADWGFWCGDWILMKEVVSGKEGGGGKGGGGKDVHLDFFNLGIASLKRTNMSAE